MSTSRQKLDVILKNKVVKKLMLSKISITKNKYAENSYSSMKKKKMRKIPMIFDAKKLTSKVKVKNNV